MINGAPQSTSVFPGDNVWSASGISVEYGGPAEGIRGEGSMQGKVPEAHVQIMWENLERLV